MKHTTVATALVCMITALALPGIAQASAAPAASAAVQTTGDHDSADANAAVTRYGNTQTGGKEFPQTPLIQGTLNMPCIGIESLTALANIGDQDMPVVTSQELCGENSTVSDDPLSHILSDIPILSGNASSHGR